MSPELFYEGNFFLNAKLRMALLRFGRGSLGLRFRCWEGTSPWVEKEKRLRIRKAVSKKFLRGKYAEILKGRGGEFHVYLGD